MFEEFASIKEELGVSFGALFAIVSPVIKFYVASINRRFRELEGKIRDLQKEGDNRSAKLYVRLDELKDDVHKVETVIAKQLAVLSGDIKLIQSHLFNGKRGKNE